MNYTALFCCYQILTTVLQTPVEMVEHARMKSTITRALVQWDALITTVQEVVHLYTDVQFVFAVD